MNALKDAALRYAAVGWPVFPCESRGKRPRTQHGLLDASTDARTIEDWWRADGNANIGVVTGPRSGLLVLDVDAGGDNDDGRETLRDLEQTHGDLPRTASVETPSGGQHYFFRYPTAIEVRNSAGLLGVGLDIRGEGGYVLAPPSQGRNGSRYEPDERAPLADPPAWLLKLLTRPENSVQAAPASEWLAIANGVAEGQRNTSLTRLVGHLLRRYVDVDLAAVIAHMVNERFRPPLPMSEVDRIVDSVAGLEARRRAARQS